jgi:enterochelin esterase-like enzyme
MDIESLVNDVASETSPIIRDEEVIFTYSGKAESVFLAGDYNRWELKDKMKKLKNKDIWYTKKIFPANSRFDYKYIIDGNWITDPLNKNMTPGGSGFNSTLIMPGYQSDYEKIINQDVPRGSLISNLEYHSDYLDTQMRYHVYLPFDYDKEKTQHILYALDGNDYINFSKINLILDYMVSTNEIPKTVAILIDPSDRTKEYTLYEPTYNYIINELMPCAENKYLQPVDPIERSVIGVSWGGLTAIYLALNTPGKFLRVLSQSGSFWPKDWIIFNMVKEMQISNIHFCLQTGTVEDTEEMNDVMYELLSDKGYNIDYVKYAESHSWGNWKGHLNEGLKVLYSGISRIQ